MDLEGEELLGVNRAEASGVFQLGVKGAALLPDGSSRGGEAVKKNVCRKDENKIFPLF